MHDWTSRFGSGGDDGEHMPINGAMEVRIVSNYHEPLLESNVHQIQLVHGWTSKSGRGDNEYWPMRI
jgi:hypothetical protein